MLHRQNTGGVLCCLANREQAVILRKEEKYIIQISRINNAKLNLQITVERNRNGKFFLRVLAKLIRIFQFDNLTGLVPSSSYFCHPSLNQDSRVHIYV